MTISILFMLIALALFLVAGFSAPFRERYHLGWLGAASVTIAWLIESGFLR